MSKTTPRVRVKKSATIGETITIRSLIAHRMESGLRKDEHGQRVPRKLIHRFSAYFNGTEIFQAELGPGIAANPYFQFDFTVNQSGVFNFKWFDDDGTINEADRPITVTESATDT